MKIIDLSLVFVILFGCIFVKLDLTSLYYEQNGLVMEEYNRIIDKAAWDSMHFSAESQYYEEIRWNPKEVIERFQKCLSDGFGIFHDKTEQMRLMDQVSVIILTEADGYYVYGYEENTKKAQLSEKRYFYLEGQKIETPFEGEGEVRKAVIKTIVEEMEEKINADAKRRGCFGKYKVTLPYVRMEEWYQGVEKISMLVFFQTSGRRMDGKEYQRFVFSGARIERKKEG